MIALLAAFICAIMVYCFVLGPIRALQDLIKDVRAKGLFCIHDPVAVGNAYAAQLKNLSLESELTAEVLKLSFIRRFEYALWATGTFYAFVFASFLILRRCT